MSLEMVDCEECLNRVFADNNVDFVNWVLDKHPEIAKEFREREKPGNP